MPTPHTTPTKIAEVADRMEGFEIVDKEVEEGEEAQKKLEETKDGLGEWISGERYYMIVRCREWVETVSGLEASSTG